MIKLARSGMTKLSLMIGRMPIQLKLISSFICIILIPIILVSWYLFNDVYLNSIADLTKRNQYILDIEKANVASNTELMGRTAQLAVSNNEVNEYLQTLEELDTEALVDFKMKTFSSFQYFLFNNPNISMIRLYTDNPHVREFWPIIFRKERVREESWYQSVSAQNGTVWWEIGENNGELIESSPGAGRDRGLYVMLLREQTYPNPQQNYMLEVSMGIGSFFMKTFSSVQDSESQMVVVDRSGRAYTNEAAAIFERLPVTEVLRQLETHGAGKGNEESSFSFDFEGIPYLVIPADLEQLDAQLVQIVSLESTLSEVSQTRNTIIMATVILIALLSLSSYFLHSLILKKLKILRESMKKVRKGDFNVDIAITSMDEVGELAYHFRQMLNKVNELIVEAVNRQAAAKEAELNSLKNQIDAHFLYNTLENLKMLAEIEGQYTISDALTSLGGMMRYNLQWTSSHVLLKDELAHIQNYIAIMNVRYDHNLALVIEVPPAYMEQEVLKMSLQPIVENAVKHGMSRQGVEQKLVIVIKAYRMNDNMVIEVGDNGCGIDEAKLREVNRMIRLEDAEYQQMRTAAGRREREGSGIGLRNVDRRIAMYYGKPHGLRIESARGSFTKVTMTLPYLILAGGERPHAQPADCG